jgi:hypothetical protein
VPCVDKSVVKIPTARHTKVSLHIVVIFQKLEDFARIPSTSSYLAKDNPNTSSYLAKDNPNTSSYLGRHDLNDYCIQASHKQNAKSIGCS